MTEDLPMADEQRQVTQLYRRLDELRDEIRTKLAQVRRTGPQGSPQNRSERDAFATMYEDRLRQLESIEERLCFGRLDFDDETVRYIGRIGLSDAQHTPILTDWRAPAAESFYQATAHQRQGVWRRRHLLTQGRKVVGIDDDLLDISRADDDRIAGEGALMAALGRSRSDKMRDIVATIQREQDAIIRSELDGALVVQGGPGTGKTAVALHRAAYLLYAHRERLERSGVLIVGPSRAFLRYIDQVLPSLGETGVVTSTLGQLIPGINTSNHDDPVVAEIKGRAIWADIVQRAISARQRVPAQDISIELDGTEVTITRADVAEAIVRARRTRRPHNEARATFVREMLRRLTNQYLAARQIDLESPDRTIVTEDLRTHRTVRRELNLCWFPISPQDLIRDLYAKPHRLAQAAPSLRVTELKALYRDRDHDWTLEDVPILDEAYELVGDIDQSPLAVNSDVDEQAQVRYAREVLAATGAGGGIVDAETLAQRFAAAPQRLSVVEHAEHDRSWVYGHVVVDEAQELSAMAWRSLLRRCPTRSFTIVGDVAQTSSPAGTRHWRKRLEPMFGSHLRYEELTVNYRTPSQIADAAIAVGRAQGLNISTLHSARSLPGSLVIKNASGFDLAQKIHDEVGQECENRTDKSVAIITSDLAIASELESSHLSTHSDIAARVMTPQQAKGLEFDVVMLIEPAQILAEPSGAADLFVAMTRATQRLVVIHQRDLPAQFSWGAALSDES